MDKWYGLTMEDIRALEDKTKHELDEVRKSRTYMCNITKSPSISFGSTPISSVPVRVATHLEFPEIREKSGNFIA